MWTSNQDYRQSAEVSFSNQSDTKKSSAEEIGSCSRGRTYARLWFSSADIMFIKLNLGLEKESTSRRIAK